MRCEAAWLGLGSQLWQHGARPTALLRRNRRACRRNGKSGKGQRLPHDCPPSRPQSLWLLHGAESICRAALAVHCKIPVSGVRSRLEPCRHRSRISKRKTKPGASPQLLALLSETRGHSLPQSCCPRRAQLSTRSHLTWCCRRGARNSRWGCPTTSSDG